MSDIFNQISTWANLPGHEQEIILVGLSIDTNDGGFTADQKESQDCEALRDTLGSALLTPSNLEAAGYSADPGQVTLGQLWAMPGHPRVIVNNDTCMQDAEPGAGTWNPDPPFGSGPGQSFYANQCYADPYDEWVYTVTEKIGMPGIKNQVKGAAETRAYQGGGDDWYPGDAEEPGPPMNGGLWTLFLQATPTWACTRSLADFDKAAQKQVLTALYQDWWQNDPQVHANVNIIAGDFVHDSDLATDAIAMDETYPEAPRAITPVGTDQVTVPLSAGGVAADAFAARVTGYTGAALPGARVTYQISGPAAYLGFGFKRAKTATVKSDAQGDVNPGEVLSIDQLEGLTGTWTVTATAAGGTHATWTLNVVPDGGVHLEALVADDTVQVGKRFDVMWPSFNEEGAFAVHAKDVHGNLVADVEVTVNLGSAGTFPNGSNTVTVPTSGADVPGFPVAVTPPFTAATQAGTFSVSISAPGADNTLSLPVTLYSAPAVSFLSTQGNGQSTPINTKFPIALKGHWLDQYGNVGFPRPCCGELTLRPASGGTWPNGTSSATIRPGADGTVTAPDLTASNTVPAPNGALRVVPAGIGGWDLTVTSGPPAKVAPISGASQQTTARKRFARALSVKVTDARGHPIAGAPVIFKVTSGKATFAQVDLKLAAAAVIGGAQILLHLGNPPRDAVTESTNAQGVAIAPALTAGPESGPIAVTASVGVSGKVKAVFRISVVSRRRR